MGELHVIGVRHHSPACARLVAHVVRRERPRFVLIEGPSDMNDRLGELGLGHELPIAIFSYAKGPTSHRASWSPFCAYSPEWVALEETRKLGSDAEALFIDLPAWHDAFSEVMNRYSTRHERASRRMQALCDRLGVEDTDSLWDHLFEQPLPPDALAERLTTYFHELRDDEDPGDRDRVREAYMARWIAWAVRESGTRSVVVVCGGYHEPELRRAWKGVESVARPEVPSLGADARYGSYLVPYSFRRLDSFVGYDSGMPSPEFYQRVWERGAEAAGEEMLAATVTHLRSKKQRVSAADTIAAMTLARGLRLLRGHEELARVDVLDGLAGAVIKDSLEAALPWNRRGVLERGTDPMLVEIVRAFSGDRAGKLAAGTPRPPLLSDVQSELTRVGITPTRKAQRITADLTAPAGLDTSRVLHRLRVLGLPGLTLTRGPSFTRTATSLGEEWSLVWSLEAEASLIEASAYGATLEGAAGARLEEMIGTGLGIAALARALKEAALVGIHTLALRLLGDVQSIVGMEPDFDPLGEALADLLALFRYDVLLGAAGAPLLRAAIEAAFERGLWLFEGLTGAGSDAQILGVRAIRDALRLIPRLTLDVTRAESVMHRRVGDPEAPPPVRGAAMGCLWSLRTSLAIAVTEDDAVAATRSAARPSTLGDFLAGLFALAREEVLAAPELLRVIDGLVLPMSDDDFLIAAPSLRLAFGYFPPKEKEEIAKRVLALHGLGAAADAREVLRLDVGAHVVLQGMTIERDVARLAERFGLSDEETKEPRP